MTKFLFLFLGFVLFANIAMAELPIRCSEINPRNYSFITCQEFDGKGYILITYNTINQDSNELSHSAYLIGRIMNLVFGPPTSSQMMGTSYRLEFGDNYFCEATTLDSKTIKTIRIGLKRPLT